MDFVGLIVFGLDVVGFIVVGLDVVGFIVVRLDVVSCHPRVATPGEGIFTITHPLEVFFSAHLVVTAASI